MIEFKTGDLFLQDAEALVNTVNCVGVMGRGVALQFKKRFPDNFKAYAAACKRDEVIPGKMFVYETGTVINPRIIINFPTKRHWRGASRVEDIESGLHDLERVIKEYNIKSIVLPPLGCGLGGLNWDLVRKRIESHLEKLADTEVIVFEPQGAPASGKMVKKRKVPNMTPGRAALIELMYRYLAGLLDPFVTLLEVHKLLYFLQESGENLRLKYAKAQYGPYAENLSHVLNAVEGHYVSGYADGGDSPNKQLKLVPGAYDEAAQFLREHKDTGERFARVSGLVEGFESPFGLELLATVHWVSQKDNAANLESVIQQVYSWDERKKQFKEHQIRTAYNVLKEGG